MLDIRKIVEMIPHRYPFLLVDRVLEQEENESITVLKNVTIAEPFFQGHFPGLPIMPGVLIIEAMAQAGALLMYPALSEKGKSDKLQLLVGIDKARFRQPVVPGDQLIIRVNVKNTRRNFGICAAVAEVENKPVANAEIKVAVAQ